MSHKEQSEFEELESLLGQFEDAVLHDQIINFTEEEFEDIIHFYLQNNCAQKALEASVMALKRFPFSSEFCLAKADAYLELGELNNAEDLLINNFKIDKSDIDYYIILSEVYLLKNDYERAVLVCKEGLENCGDQTDTLLLHLAEIYDYQGEYLEMIPLLEKSLLLNPLNEDAYYLYSITMSILERNTERIAFIQGIIDEDPFNVFAWYALGMSYKDAGLIEKAIESFEYIAAIDETNNDIVSDMAQAYLEAGQPEKAIECLKDIEKKGDLNSVDHYTLGHAHYRLNNNYKAKLHFKEALNYDEIADEAYYNLAIIFFEENKYSAALPLIQKALEKNADIAHYLELKADILYQLGDLEGSLETFNKILTQSTKTPYYIHKLAFLYAEKHGLGDAIGIVEQGIENYDFDVLYFYKAILYFYFGEEVNGLNAFSIGLQKDYDSHSVVFDYLPDLIQSPKIQLLLSQFEE